MNCKIAFIYNRNMRVRVGERCSGLVKKVYPNLHIENFDLKEIYKTKEKFDFYIRLDDGDYSVPLPDGLGNTLWWVADTHLKNSFNAIKRNALNLDYLLCWQYDGAEKLKKVLPDDVNVSWLPPAADYIDDYSVRYVSHNNREIDLCFVGTRGKYSLRKVMLEYIETYFENCFVGEKEYFEIFDTYSNAGIVLNYSINNDINMRFFEAMGAGALLITNEIEGNGFSELFGDSRKYLITYKLDELLDEKLFVGKIRDYIRNLELRESVARRAYDYVNEKHTYKNRLDFIFALLGVFK